MKILSLFCSVIIVTVTLASFASAETYQHQVEVKDMTFAWKIEGDTLHGKMSAKTKGWVAVGFNPSSKMKDANFILGYVKNGKAKVVDHFGDRSVGHSEDTKKGGTEDVTLVSGSEEKKITTIEFTIPMNSGDKLDGVLSADGDTVLLLAYGPDRDSFKTRHKFRDTKTVNLSTGAVK
ncbi:MAG: DOMON domain-containing protein [Desulfobulbaceae bacterium]|nr:MAG: DOMON domain-containing protein [Desulfobulbaceae bacterium]